MSEHDYQVEIAQGATVMFANGEGDYQLGNVRKVFPDRGLVECWEHGGVLRMSDIRGVAVYGDEAEYVLNDDGTGGDRIQTND